MKELFALTILRIINLQFGSQIGANPDYISFVNSNDNSIYVNLQEDCVTISAYKVSSQCFNKSITDISQLEDVVTELKGKIKCSDNTI